MASISKPNQSIGKGLTHVSTEAPFVLTNTFLDNVSMYFAYLPKDAALCKTTSYNTTFQGS